MQYFGKEIIFLSIYLILSSTYYRAFPKSWRGYINNNYQQEINSYSDTLQKINIELKKDNTFESLKNINKIYSDGIAYIWPDQINSITFSDNWILIVLGATMFQYWCCTLTNFE